jgi:DNA-binding CsgD family transcriptional regulator
MRERRFMLSEPRLLSVIERIYESAVDPAGLDKLAHTLAHTFETDSALVIFDKMPQPGVPLPATVALPSATENFDVAARWAHAEHFHDLNIWLTEGLKNPLPAIVICHELVDEATLMRHEWYDFCRQTEMFHCLGTAFQVGDDLMGEIGIHRRRHEKPFTDEDKQSMGQLLPHIQRALQMQHRLGTMERERALTLDILSGLAIGVVIVDMKCRVLFSNHIAENALRSGAIASVSNGRLTLTDPAQSSELAVLVGNATRTSCGASTGAGGVINVNRSPDPPVLMMVSPLRSTAMGFGPRIPAATIIFSDTHDIAAVPETTLAAMYGLTPSEAALVAAIVEGETLPEYADRRGIAVGTVRTHLKHVLQKSGFNRQIDLIRAVAGSPLVRLSQSLP